MFPDDNFEFDDPLLVYKSVSDQDTSYFYEAMRKKDKAKHDKEIITNLQTEVFTAILRFV
jgi:hypothetical protein